MELDKIFKIIIRNNCITTYELTKLGYIDEDIVELIDDGYLRRRERGVYVLADPEKLLEYARLIKDRKPDFYSELIKYYNLITKKDITSYYELFDKGIQNKNYSDLITYYKVIDEDLSRNKEMKKTSNLYLLLISYLYAVPEEFASRLDNIDLEKLLLDGDSETIKLENKLRKDLFYRSFYEAMVSFKKKISMQKEFSLKDKVEKDLIKAVIEKYRKFKEEVINLINENEFEKLLVLLYTEDDRNFLNVKNCYLLKVVIDYVDINNSKQVPYIKRESNNTFQSINNKDYKKALAYMEEYKDDKNINYQDTLYMMLIKINELIETLNSNKEKILEEVIEKYRPKKEKVKEEIKEDKEEIKEDKEEKIEVVEETLKVKRENKLVLETKDIKRIEKQVQEIYDGKPMVILNKIDPSKNDLVLQELNKYREIAYFKIGEGDRSRVVVRARPHLKERINIRECVEEAKKALHQDRNYKRAEELYRLLLQIGTPRDVTYGEYGLTLLRLHKKNDAIPYLKVATELSKEQGHSLDYSDLIMSLEGTIDKSEEKPKVRMREEDFRDNRTFNLELDYLDDLVALVEAGELDLEGSMTSLGLDEENKNIIRLICARDCYYQEKYKDGDKYIQKVESSSEKTNNVKRILRVVKETKKYYKNRFNKEEENQLVFRK